MAATPKRNTPTRRRSTTTNRKRKTPTTATTTTLTTLLPTLTTAISAVQTFLLTHDTHLLPPHLFTLHTSLSKLHSLVPSSLPSPSPSPSSWFERFVLSSITDDDPRWTHFFNMSKPTFSILTSILTEPLSASLPETIPVHFAVGCALFKLAHAGSYSFVGRRFGFVANDACRVFYAFCKVVCEVLGGCFGRFTGPIGGVLMKNCVGVLGFEKFRVDGGELLGKDGFLIVQGLVDSNGRFLDVSVGWPSSFSPFSILRQSRLFLGVEESKDLLNGPEIELFDGNFVSQYVLGDSWYPCLPWLITPFARKNDGDGDGDGLSSSEIEFNEVHRKTMGLVKMAFSRVRANWKLLNRKWKEEFVQFLPFIITTACVLNNFLMEHGETLPDGDFESGEEVDDMPGFVGEVSESEGGARVRNLLALHLSKDSIDLISNRQHFCQICNHDDKQHKHLVIECKTVSFEAVKRLIDLQVPQMVPLWISPHTDLIFQINIVVNGERNVPFFT